MVGLKRGREGKTINYYKMRKNTEIFHQRLEEYYKDIFEFLRIRDCPA
jgi:hypothetical protein